MLPRGALATRLVAIATKESDEQTIELFKLIVAQANYEVVKQESEIGFYELLAKVAQLALPDFFVEIQSQSDLAGRVVDFFIEIFQSVKDDICLEPVETGFSDVCLRRRRSIVAAGFRRFGLGGKYGTILAQEYIDLDRRPDGYFTYVEFTATDNVAGDETSDDGTVDVSPSTPKAYLGRGDGTQELPSSPANSSGDGRSAGEFEDDEVELVNRTTLVHDDVPRDGRRGGVGKSLSSGVLHEASVRFGDLSEYRSATLPRSVCADSVSTNAGHKVAPGAPFRPPRKIGSSGADGSRLESASNLLLEGAYDVLERGPEQKRRKTSAERSVCEVRVNGRHVGRSGGHGSEVVRAKFGEISQVASTLPDVVRCEADDGAFGGLAVRIHGDAKDILRVAVRDGNATESVCVAPDVKRQGPKTVVSWSVKSGDRDIGRRTPGDATIADVPSVSGSDGVSSGSERGVCLFYVKSVVRNSTGCSVGVLALAAPDGGGASNATDQLRSFFSFHGITHFSVDPTGLPGYCCVAPFPNGKCAECCRREQGERQCMV